MNRVWRALVGVSGMLVVGAAMARTPGPLPCPDVRFLSDRPLLGGAASSDAFVVDGVGQVVIDGACAAVPARWTNRRDGSALLRARWASCGSAVKVRLRARYDATCTTASGRLSAQHRRPVAFAAAPSRCGDGHLNPVRGESCELTTPCASTPCIDCQCEPSSSTTTTTTTLAGATTTTTLAGLFEAANPWNMDVSGLSPSSESGSIIAALTAAGGWGNGNKLQIDFGLHVLHAGPTTSFLTFTKSTGYYTPDCDEPFPFPLPAGGAIEGQAGYTCNVAAEDCHLLVVDAAAKRLYETYNATMSSSMLVARCGLFWDLTRSYPSGLRGEQCTSADAAGFPIAALLFTADEVAAGDIPHAIRFILPNDRMRAGVYVHPASHAGGPSGGASLPPYGVRFRLRADFPLATLPSEGARVIARAMQRYGMLLADGGNIALTAASDTFTTHTWDEVGIDSHSLFGIAVTDMEVVDLGPTIPLTYDCVRNP